MADYYLLLDAGYLESKARPALAASRRERSFEWCLPLCKELAPAARRYAERYHLGDDEPLLIQLAHKGTAIDFSRDLWRALVGEVLLFCASEIPEFQSVEDALTSILAPASDLEKMERAAWPPIVQAHRGSRDLTFGAVVYRPDDCGFNNTADVARLAAYLELLDPYSWTVADLGQIEDADLADELEFAREWFPSLREMYQRARERAWVVVRERIY